MAAAASDPLERRARDHDSKRSRLASRVGLFFLFAFGVTLRLCGISFGLPFHHHWDEGWIVDSVVGMLRRHDDIPASYQYGEPMMRLTELAFVAVRWAQHTCCAVSPVDAQTTVYLLARVVSAVISSTGILAVYIAVRADRSGARASAWAALAAALLYATASELVLHSRYAVTDACLVAFTAWTFAFAARYLASRSVVCGVLCALAAGVTFAFKAPGIMSTSIPLLAALFLYANARRHGLPQGAHLALLLATIPLVLATYGLLNHHIFDRSADAFRDLVGRYRQTRDGGFSSVYLRKPGLPHLWSAVAAMTTQFASRNVLVSLAVTATALWGAVAGIRNRDPLIAIAVLYTICLVLSVALPNRTFLYRNYLVTIAATSITFGTGAVDLARRLRLRARPRGAWGLVLLALHALVGGVAMIGLPLVDALEAQRDHGDPRAEAIEWISQQTRDAPAVDVAVTPSVFGKVSLGTYPELRGIVGRPTLRFLAHELETCPDPVGGPRYVIDASYRDVHKAPSSDPWQELWFFRQCTGYRQVAAFELDRQEINLRAYPTWPGRVSAIVLQRSDPETIVEGRRPTG